MHTEGLTTTELIYEGFIPLLYNNIVYYVNIDEEYQSIEAKTNAYTHNPSSSRPLKIRNWNTLCQLYDLFIQNRKEKREQNHKESISSESKKRGNMYMDSILQWNVGVGCFFRCKYCVLSFQAQMKRQKHNCIKCYNYEPHFHPERLDRKLPKTSGDEFIWAFSSADISFMKKKWVNQVIEKIRENPEKTFFFQTKNPKCFEKYSFPNNLLLGITLETNKEDYYKKARISKAPLPHKRVKDFISIDHPHKCITIEPILQFDLDMMLKYCLQIHPERIYMGYDSKNSFLREPTYYEFQELKKGLEEALPKCKVKTKFIKKDFWEDQTTLTKFIGGNK